MSHILIQEKILVVASQDWPEITKYAGLVCAQGHRQELIQDLYKSWQDPNRGGTCRMVLVRGNSIKYFTLSLMQFARWFWNVYAFYFLRFKLLVKYCFEHNVLVVASFISKTPIKGLRFIGVHLSASCHICCRSEMPSHKVRFVILETEAYGVPQSRKRAFIWAASPEETLPEWPMHVFAAPELKVSLPQNNIYC